MRSKYAAMTIAVGLVLGFIALVATGGTSCGDVFGVAESRLQPSNRVTGRLGGNPDAGFGEVAWVLSTGENETRSAIVDLGGWTGYVDRTEISRIGNDGTVAWTRSNTQARYLVLGASSDDSRLGLITGIDGETRLAILDADGALTRCDVLFNTGAAVAPDADGGYAAVGGGSSEDTATEGAERDTVRRIEADGSPRWSSELDIPVGRFVAEVFVGSGLTVVSPGDAAERAGDTVLAVFDDDSGQPIWDWKSPTGDEWVTSVLGIVDDLLYVTTTDAATDLDQLMTLDAQTGRVRWSIELSHVGVERGNLIQNGDSVIVGRPGAATAIDPGSGQVLWQSFAGYSFSYGDRLEPIVDIDGRSVQPLAGEGLLVDLSNGYSTPFFTGGFGRSIDGVAVDGDVLIADITVLRSTGDSAAFVTGWPFDPAEATFSDAPFVPE